MDNQLNSLHLISDIIKMNKDLGSFLDMTNERKLELANLEKTENDKYIALLY